MIHSCRQVRSPRSIRKAFTLVEIIIVVLILGILAALVVPQVSSAADTARENSLRDDLRILRTQIMVYRAQHNGISPGYPNGDLSAAPTELAFVQQLTMYTNERGEVCETASAEFKFGPYLRTVPANAITGIGTITFLDDGQAFPEQPTGTGGWLYKPDNGTLAADVQGSGRDGDAFFNF